MSTGEPGATPLPALMFRYRPGTMQARFYHSTADYIELDLRMGGDTTWVQEVEPLVASPLGPERRYATSSVEETVYFSSVWCAFPAFIQFLEAITTGVEECGFSWDPEGPYGHMHWHAGHGDKGSFRLAWHSRGGNFDVSTSVRTYDAVETLYSAFRSFVDSREYEPFRYEKIQEWDAYSLILEDATVGEFARAVAKHPASKAVAVLERAWGFASGRGMGTKDAQARRRTLEWFLDAPPVNDELLASMPASWDRWDQARRTRYLGRRWSTRTFGCDGANLRRLRSHRVEAWLAGKRPKGQRGPTAARTPSP